MPVTVATSAGGISSSGPKSQQRAHTRDSRAAVGRRHLLYELERHPFEASPLTQLFAVLARRRPSWWSSSEQQPTTTTAADTTTAAATTTSKHLHPSSGGPLPRSRATKSSSASASAASKKRKLMPTTTGKRANTSSTDNLNASVDSGGGGGNGTMNSNHTDVIDDSNMSTNNATAAFDPDDPCRDLVVPDTVVWETNIPKGWFTFDAKEQHVLRRKVETKAIQRAFLKGARYADDVVAVLYCSDGAADSGEPAQQFQFITAAALEGFLFEHGRGKGTAILQQFVPSLHAAMNDCIEAVWSPTVCHVSRRQNIHEIADERYDINDRCVTFEAKTHLSRLVQSTSRLRAQVKGACESLVRHFHGCDTRHVITRLVCRFKMTSDSELNLLHCVSARVMRAAAPSAGPKPTGGGGDDDLEAALRADDGGNSVFYRQYRVALDVAVKYTERPPPAVATESRSVLSRLQERNEAERRRRNEERRARERREDEEDGVVVVTGRSNALGSSSPSRAATPSPLAAATAASKPTTSHTTSAKPRPKSAGGLAEQHQQSDVTVAGQLASRRGFVVRPTRTADRQASLPADSAAKSQTANPGAASSSSRTVVQPLDAGGDDDLDAAAWGLVTSAEFQGFAGAAPPQQRKVSRVLDRVLRTAGAASVRRALLQAHEEDLTDGERMELLGLMLQQQQQQQQHTAMTTNGGGGVGGSVNPLAARLPRTWRRSDADAKTREALRQAAESPTRCAASDTGAWALVKQAVEDATYPAYNDTTAAVSVDFPSCPVAGPTLLPKLVALVNDASAANNLVDTGSGICPSVVLLRDALLQQFGTDDGGGDAGYFAATPSEAAAVIVISAVLSAPSCRALREAGLSCDIGPAPHYPLSISFTIAAPSRSASTRICQRVTFAASELVAQLGNREGLPLRFGGGGGGANDVQRSPESVPRRAAVADAAAAPPGTKASASSESTAGAEDEMPPPVMSGDEDAATRTNSTSSSSSSQAVTGVTTEEEASATADVATPESGSHPADAACATAANNNNSNEADEEVVQRRTATSDGDAADADDAGSAYGTDDDDWEDDEDDDEAGES